jgi:outer membrane protein OmpA-like peptidoglycan-associated protein
MASYAQEIKSKADQYFYMYAYKQAISAYQKDMAKGELISNHQLLNLADSYFNSGDYNNASKIYLDINKKDSIMNNHHFNKMLQSMSKTSEIERVKAFLSSKEASLSSELMENASFNFELLASEGTSAQKFDLFNVSSNSPQSDLSPAFYKDKLLFSSGRTSKSKKVYGPSGESYYDIYVARIGNDGNVLNANVFTRMPASEYHKTSPYYSEKSGKIFYILSNSEDGQLTFDENGKNSLAIGLVFENGFFAFLLRDLSTSFYYPYFDEKSERLYFAANFDDSYGGTDIYYVATNNGQIMTQPVNLGPRINSPGNEISPYILDNSLYFSSDTFYGLGGMDIYKSKMREDGSYSIPINLGSGINTDAHEFGFIIQDVKDAGFSGYFASNRKGGKGKDDIYSFRINELIGPKTIAFKGEVVEPKYQQGIQGATFKLMEADGTIIKEFTTKSDGAFQIEIPWRESVVLQISKNGRSSFYNSYTGEALKYLQKEPLVIQMMAIDEVVTEKEGKTVLAIDDFFFARGKSEITAAIGLELEKVVSIIQKFPQLQFQIETHTDSRGGSNTNKVVSQKRADAIKNYLLQKGVPSTNITSAQGYGEERIMNNCTNGVYCLEFLHKQNLRSLFVVQNYEQLK